MIGWTPNGVGGFYYPQYKRYKKTRRRTLGPPRRQRGRPRQRRTYINHSTDWDVFLGQGGKGKERGDVATSSAATASRFSAAIDIVPNISGDTAHRQAEGTARVRHTLPRPTFLLILPPLRRRR